jgi:hypothetical protein
MATSFEIILSDAFADGMSEHRTLIGTLFSDLKSTPVCVSCVPSVSTLTEARLHALRHHVSNARRPLFSVVSANSSTLAVTRVDAEAYL